MTTKDSTLVRLPNSTLARLDARRGRLSRAKFLDELLDARPLATRPAPAPVRSTQVEPRWKKGKG